MYFAFHEVVRQHYSGGMSKLTTFLCEIFSRFFTPTIIKIGSFFSPSYSKYKVGVF